MESQLGICAHVQTQSSEYTHVRENWYRPVFCSLKLAPKSKCLQEEYRSQRCSVNRGNCRLKSPFATSRNSKEEQQREIQSPAPGMEQSHSSSDSREQSSEKLLRCRVGLLLSWIGHTGKREIRC